eukprot:1367638-Amorphochlora_amoeboformis.AAC.1
MKFRAVSTTGNPWGFPAEILYFSPDLATASRSFVAIEGIFLRGKCKFLTEKNTDQKVGIASIGMYQPVPENVDNSLDSGEENKEQVEDLGEDSIELNMFLVGKGKKQIRALPNWTVKEFKEHIFPDEGKLLKNEDTLENVGLQKGSFVHCSICEFNPTVVNNPQDENHNAHHSALHRDLEEAQIPPWLLQAQFSRQGSNGDFILGFIMGFFLGVLTLIWVWQRAVPRRQKLGIMLG